ncbi:MAG TPA: hypothetical protein VHM30_01500 [Gemmatimonadaceae bacterium]|nr:hypothetical protein [Gemmatimonadaceae bacterium]
MRWRLLATPPLGGAENMALDEALLRRAAATGEAVFRLYAWSAPTLSLGRNQPALEQYDRDALAARRVDVVRRLTGGRAVLHHRELTYSVTAPLSLGATLRDAYLRINRLLLLWLRTLGVDAAIAEPAGRAPIPSTSPCFEEPTEGELVVGGRKLVGSAQYRDEWALLQHGSVLIEDDQSIVPTLLRVAAPAPPPPATLRDVLGRVPEPAESVAALADALRTLEDLRLQPLEIEHDLQRALDETRPRYEDPAWTWRR